MGIEPDPRNFLPQLTGEIGKKNVESSWAEPEPPRLRNHFKTDLSRDPSRIVRRKKLSKPAPSFIGNFPSDAADHQDHDSQGDDHGYTEARILEIDLQSAPNPDCKQEQQH